MNKAQRLGGLEALAKGAKVTVTRVRAGHYVLHRSDGAVIEAVRRGGWWFVGGVSRSTLRDVKTDFSKAKPASGA